MATALPGAGSPELRTGLGSVLALLGLAVTLGAHGRFRQVDRALREGRPLPRTRVPLLTTAVLAAVAVGALVVVLRS